MKMESIADAPAKPLKKKLPSRALLVLGAALVVGGSGVAYVQAAKGSATTDNAYVKADVTIVAPRVRGHVDQVLVADNQPVKAGQLLVRLDSEEYAARVAGALADLATADAELVAAQAALARHAADEALAAASVREAQTGITSADAELSRARADWGRYEPLVKTGYATRREADRVEATAIAAQAQAEKSRAALAVSRSQADAVRGRRPELAAVVAEKRAQRDRFAAALNLARQDRDHAEIRAPIDGVVGDRQANVGDYVQPGSRLLVVTPLDRLYITANFKETQTARMLKGQTARVRVDALPGVTLKAHIESFAPGTGSEFALLPFEPGVGNFTKIVQRVPVRLRFDPGQKDLERLRPGLSAKVAVALDGQT
jgi:membrane fusion protein (multidrug efflux system)